MSESPVLIDVEDGICTLTMNRPDKLNAFNVPLMKAMISAFDVVDSDDDIRVVIVTGAGRAFCAGADLEAGGESFDYDGGSTTLGADKESESSRWHRDGGGILALRIFRCTKPVIAAINGHAVGVGATMTLPMDFRLAADTAKVGFVFNARGIAPEACSSYFLPKLVGISQAVEWVYTARVFSSDEGQRGGLIRSVHTGDELMAAARALAAEIITNSAPVSVALSRMMMWRMLGASHPMEAHRIDSRAVQFTGSQPDAIEGITSFLQKRPAEWSMSVSDDMPDWVPWWEEPTFE